MATIQKIILLKRDPSKKNIVTALNVDEAVQCLLPTASNPQRVKTKKNCIKNKFLSKTIRTNRRLPCEHNSKSS
jgi:hypothetical protein